jgi:hypothetical protein
MGNFTKDKSPYFQADLGFLHVANHTKKHKLLQKPAILITGGRLSTVH